MKQNPIDRLLNPPHLSSEQQAKMQAFKTKLAYVAAPGTPAKASLSLVKAPAFEAVQTSARTAHKAQLDKRPKKASKGVAPVKMLDAPKKGNVPAELGGAGADGRDQFIDGGNDVVASSAAMPDIEFQVAVDHG